MPNYSHSAPAAITRTPLTTALTRAIDIFQFSQHPKLLRTFLELVDTTVVASHENALGNIIEFVSNPLTLKLLTSWSEHSADANDLKDLGNFLADRKSPASPKPITDAKSGRLQLLGELDRCFVLALILERLPRTPKDPDQWLFRLRVWLILHAFMRNRRGIRLDENIKIVSNGVRIGCDTDPQWLRFFLSLQISEQDRPLSEFNYRINTGAQKQYRDEHLLPKEKAALNALIEISSNKDKQIKSSSGLPASTLNDLPGAPSNWSQSAVFDLDEDEGSQLIDGGTGETSFICTKPPASFTPAERKLSARTVLFATAETMQFLPWSWQRPNPYESRDLKRWIDKELSSNPSSSSRALAAAMIWVANALGRSIARMLAIRVGSAPDDEWVFDAECGIFRRLPPMRRPGWLPNDEARPWIVPVAPEISIQPPDTARLILMQAVRESDHAGTLRELWPRGNTSTPESAILDCLHDVSKRLTRSMLAESLPQRAFDLHHDAVLARLVASHPQSAFAGAHSYAQWRLDTVTSLLSDQALTTSDPHWRETALGSRLALLEAPLRNAIAEATHHVLATRRNGDPITLHNALTAYTVIALLAATGGRPIRSPFESVLHFDFDEHLAFLDDKHGSPNQDSGRVLPLPRTLSAFIRTRYLPHLLALSATLSGSAPSLAREIELCATEQPTGAFPLFFFLDPESLDWREVSPSNVFLISGIEWPLPANVFRHRLANRLREQKLDPEIIDGLLGHGEWGNDTWSSTSFRCWADDVRAARPALEAVFHSLRFRPIRGLQAAVQISPVSPRTGTFLATRFGSAARRQERTRRFIAAIRDAKCVVREFLGGKLLEELDADALDQLADRLARTVDGMPSATGAIRLAYLQRQLEKVERQSGRRVRPRSERAFVQEEPSLFTSDFHGARSNLGRLRELLPPPTFEATSLQSLAAALSLCIESRVCDAQLLLDVAANRNCRSVRVGEDFYLEYGCTEPDVDVAGRRFKISSCCALWFSRARGHTSVKAGSFIPPAFRPMADSLSEKPRTIGSLIEVLARLVRQVNAMTLPGVVCGALSGELSTTALGWRDMTRLLTGRQILLKGGPDADLCLAAKPFIPPKPPKKAAPDSRTITSNFLKELRGILEEPSYHPSARKNPRRLMLSEMNLAIKKGAKAGVSPAILLLAQWIHVLAQPAGRKVLVLSTLRRYLSALAWRFQNEMLSIDLLDADCDELTEAYERILLSGDKPAGTFELERLATFHGWLRSNFDIESPDWQELPVVKAGLGISPGFIRPEEYLSALAAIRSDVRLDSHEQTCAAMLLLLAYRFGLRRREALGLKRSDWDNSGERIVVTVVSNSMRKLKTTSSRRQVPQVFSFQASEEDLVATLLTCHFADHGDDHVKPLLVVEDPHKLASVVLDSLKKVTGNPGMTIHHARHSAANEIAINALKLSLPGWTATTPENDVFACLLGSSVAASRRHGWAIARFLGHASPRTSCRSYLHFLFDWADDLVGIVPDGALAKSIDVKSITSLDAFATLPVFEPGRSAARPRKTDLAAVLEIFRLHSRGVRSSSIAAGLSLEFAAVERCVQVLVNPHDTNSESEPAELTDLEVTQGEFIEPAEGSGVANLAQIGRWSEVGKIAQALRDPAWNRLIDWAKTHLSVTKNAPLVAVSELRQIVGASNQLLAWRADHFALLRVAIDALGIDVLQYRMYGSARILPRTVSQAEASGFKIALRPEHARRGASKRPSKLQIDSAYAGPDCEFVLSRTALVLKENDVHTIRNQAQLALMVTALALTFAEMSKSSALAADVL